MFEAVGPQVSFPELEREMRALWQRLDVFGMQQSRARVCRETEKRFVFFEGPPTANGMPHPGHVLTRVMKDLPLRFATMRGKHVLRRAGWDTHGLPVEVEVEKTLGFSGKAAIEAYGVGRFAEQCLDSVFKYVDEWRTMTERIGFWLDLDDAYATYHKTYVESVWWALSELFNRGLLYQDYKIVWWWPQGGTALSAGEVGQGYKEVVDPSVVVHFPLASQAMPTATQQQLEAAAGPGSPVSFLAWTTTPWTLPSNVGLGVNNELPYALVRRGSDAFIVAEALVPALFADAEVEHLATVLGSELVGMKYEAPFAFAQPEGGRAHEVIGADFVTLDAGTGLVHLAPAFGEDDFKAAKAHGLGFLQLVEPDGCLSAVCGPFAGLFCKDADRAIIRHLQTRGLLFSEKAYKHEYPFCWRRDSDPLIQYARKSWFIRTSDFVSELLNNNAGIKWSPEHIRDGRFGSFLAGNVDWAVSRERFWGTPLPIWVNDETGEKVAISCVQALRELNPDAFAHFEAAKRRGEIPADDLMVHKPWIDAVTFTKANSPGVFRRVPEVIDCWFDSGCMPFAQWGYPHQNHEAYEANATADFISEAVDQTRGWFYAMLAVSTLLFGKTHALPHPFRRALVLGIISDEKGQKLSKSLKNYEDPLPLIERHGADAVRWALYASTVPGQGTRWHERAVTEATREILLKVWNAYSFFVTYANIDAWEPEADLVKAVGLRPAYALDTPGLPADGAELHPAGRGALHDPGEVNPFREAPGSLDAWIRAETRASAQDIAQAIEALEPHVAARAVTHFVDGLTNWYIRRSRDRFWRGGFDADKAAAFATLYTVLLDLSRMLAPFLPHLSEALYQNLRRGADAPASVHDAAFPSAAPLPADRSLRAAMTLVREAVALGQRVRAEHKVRVRQPLQSAVLVCTPSERPQLEAFAEDIKAELNVKSLAFAERVTEFAEITLVPNFRLLGPKLGTRMPKCRGALAALDGEVAYQQLLRGEAIDIELEGAPFQLSADEIEVRVTPKEGFAAASSFGIMVALDLALDDALTDEGLARELISRIQRARKDLNLPYEARIVTTVRAHDTRLARVIGNGELLGQIQAETLSKTLHLLPDERPDTPALHEITSAHWVSISVELSA